jgi:hypothetical protein
MDPKRISQLGLAAVAGLVVVLGSVLLAVHLRSQPPRLASQRQIVNGTNTPITFRYISTGQFNNGGYLSFGTTFWATNQTANEIMVTLSAIEVKTGSNWTIRSRLTEPLRFCPPRKPLAPLLLQPHEAGFATIQLPGQPTDVTWRVRVDVAEKLTGLAATTKRLQLYPDLMERRLTGNTNIPASPFATNMSVFGRTTQAVSQEISDQ